MTHLHPDLISQGRSPGRTMASAFPAELIESIVGFLWSFKLSADERISLMTTIPLFNSVWRNAYTRASSENVYIPCAAYADHFLSILHRESKFYDEETQSYFENRCRSITFVIDHLPAGSATDHPAGKAMADFLYFINDEKSLYLPNLRKVAIHYHNIGFDDIFERARLVDFPSQVTELEISHTFSPEVPSFLLSALHDNDEGHLFLAWRMPHIRHLTLGGVGSDYVANMITVCPNITSLELALTCGALKPEVYVTIPDSLRRLVLHPPEDPNFPREELFIPSAHVLHLPEPHSRTRWICLVPRTADQYSNMTRSAGMDYLIELTYPTNVTWGREVDGETGDDRKSDDEES